MKKQTYTTIAMILSLVIALFMLVGSLRRDEIYDIQAYPLTLSEDNMPFTLVSTDATYNWITRNLLFSLEIKSTKTDLVRGTIRLSNPSKQVYIDTASAHVFSNKTTIITCSVPYESFTKGDWTMSFQLMDTNEQALPLNNQSKDDYTRIFTLKVD